MKNYISGWRRRPATDVATKPARATEIPEPAPAPPTAPKRSKPASAPRQEIIDATPAAPRSLPSIVVPTLRIPTGVGSLTMLAIAIWLWTLSVGATEAALATIWPGITWATCAMVQVAFSVIERFFFVGNRNAVTWAVMLADGVINAVGIFVAFLPALYASAIWQWLVSDTPLEAWTPSGLTAKLIAILAGMALAYANDALFDMAMRGR